MTFPFCFSDMYSNVSKFTLFSIFKIYLPYFVLKEFVEDFHEGMFLETRSTNEHPANHYFNVFSFIY
jgi:hypothetical protein